MLRMRLRRVGKTKQPSYRVVIADQHAKRDGDFVEVVGNYNPRNKPNVIEFKEERVRHWLSVGVQPSETVHRLLFANGLTTIEPPKRVTKPSNAEVAATKAAAVEMLKLCAESPPVPQVSTSVSPPSTGTLVANSRMTWAAAAISPTVSFFTRKPVMIAAIINGDTSPLMICRISDSISS